MRIFGGKKSTPPAPVPTPVPAAPPPAARPPPAQPPPAIAPAVPRPVDPLLAATNSRAQRPKTLYPLLDGIKIDIKFGELPNLKNLELIDKPLKAPSYQIPDLSEELLLITEADAALAQQRRLEEEEFQTAQAIQESENLQVIVSR